MLRMTISPFLHFTLACLALPFSSSFVLPNHAHDNLASASVGNGEKRSVACAVTRLPITMPTTEPMVPYRAPGSEYAQFIGLKSRLLRDRKLWIGQFIDEEASNSIISSLLFLQSEASIGEIRLYLNVPGALLRPTLAIYDAIQQLKADGCEISTYNLALCTGMGALLAGAGTKGKRYAMPNSRFLLQKTGIDAVFQGQATDIALEVANVKKWNEKINAELASVTGQSIERINDDLKRDFYLSSEEAVRYGLVDQVLLPLPGKRRIPMDADLGSFQSGQDQKYQGEQESPPQQEQPRNPGMMQGGNDGDDGPGIAKA